MMRYMTLRRMAHLGTVGVVIGLGLLAMGCRVRGGGTLGAPLPSAGVIAAYQGKATFGFTFTCEVRNGKAVVRGQLEYHDHAPSQITVGSATPLKFTGVALHGTVDPLTFDVRSCAGIEELSFPVAQFTGTYRQQSADLAVPDTLEQGRFTVQVFDQGEPGRSKGEITGDAFSIALVGGTYNGYTRAGYIEGGNVQVEQ